MAFLPLSASATIAPCCADGFARGKYRAGLILCDTGRIRADSRRVAQVDGCKGVDIGPIGFAIRRVRRSEGFGRVKAYADGLKRYRERMRADSGCGIGCA